MATWTIDNLLSYDSRGGEENVVYAIEFSVSHTDGGNTCTINNLVNLDITDLSSFTAYNSITEETALSWVQAVLGSDEVTALGSIAESRVSEKNRDGVTVGKAW